MQRLFNSTVHHSTGTETLAPIVKRVARDVPYDQARDVTLSQFCALVAEKIEAFDENESSDEDDIGESIFNLGQKWENIDSTRAQVFFEMAIVQFGNESSLEK